MREKISEYIAQLRLQGISQNTVVSYQRDLYKMADFLEEKKKEMAERAEKFQERAAALERLSYTLDGLLIRPCASEVELRAEGIALHHCVATYAANHASGATAILFIRRASAPDEPFFTLEFDEKRLEVRQNRGLRNCDRTPEVEAFEKAWLKFVRAQNRKRRKKAA